MASVTVRKIPRFFLFPLSFLKRAAKPKINPIMYKRIAAYNKASTLDEIMFIMIYPNSRMIPLITNQTDRVLYVFFTISSENFYEVIIAYFKYSGLSKTSIFTLINIA